MRSRQFERYSALRSALGRGVRGQRAPGALPAPTPAGVLLVLVGFAFDAAPLFVVGGALVLLGVLSTAWVSLGARGVSLERRLEQERVVEEEPLETVVSVRRGALGVPGAELDDPLAAAPVDLSGPLSLMRGARSARVRIVTRYSRRGLHRVRPPELVVRDPLGLRVRRVAASGPPLDLLVLPRTEPVRWGLGRGAARAGRAGGRVAGDPLAAVDVDGLRPYRLGTPASRIHWAALARGAGLLERRLRADGDLRPLVILDARGDDDAGLDAAVRAAASLVLELARSAGCRLLLPDERRPLTVERDLVAWPSAHARLALVSRARRPPLLAPSMQAGQLFYVAATERPALPAGFTALVRGSFALIFPGEGFLAGRESFSVAGCVGFSVSARTAAAQDLVA